MDDKEDSASSEPQGFINFNELSRTLNDLDERALVLTLAAFAEDTLGDLLSAFLIPSAASRSLVTGYNAPLGTFSSRIKSTYALGLISKGQFDDLQHLREIRNKFSHTWKPITFEDPSVAGHIKAIRFSRLMTTYPEGPQQKLLTAFQYLLIELQVAVNNIPDGKRAKFIGARLWGGLVGKEFEDQLKWAEKEVMRAQENHEAAEGEKKLFFDGVLWALKDKLKRLLLDAKPDQTPDVFKLLHGVIVQLADRPDPNE